MKKISCLFYVLAGCLSLVMTAVTAYFYGVMRMQIRYAGASAPAEAAFLYAVPFGIGIAVSVLLAVCLQKKAERSAG